MTSSYLKSKSDTERKLQQYILDTIESFRNNRNVSRRNVSRGYNPRSEPDYSSNEEEGSDDLSDLWVNTNHIDEDVSDEEEEDGSSKEEQEDGSSNEEEEDGSSNEEEEETARLVSEDLSENGINFWKTNTFKKWLIEHNRLLKHYMSEGTLHKDMKRMWPHVMLDYDIDIWEYLIDENYMANLQLDYSKDNFTKLFRRYQNNNGSNRYDKSNERKLLLIHMYLREAFFARHELRNIDFRRKLCLLANSSSLVYLTEIKDKKRKKRYIRDPDLYDTVPFYIPSSYSSQFYKEKCVMFDIPRHPELLKKEYKIATGYDNILQEVMTMIMLARERNSSSPLTTSEFASQLLTLKPELLPIIHEKIQKILLE